jgi:hypothetical protein
MSHEAKIAAAFAMGVEHYTGWRYAYADASEHVAAFAASVHNVPWHEVVNAMSELKESPLENAAYAVLCGRMSGNAVLCTALPRIEDSSELRSNLALQYGLNAAELVKRVNELIDMENNRA